MTYTYCVVAKYDEGISYPECVNMEFFDGLEENVPSTSSGAVAVYPNPTSNSLNVIIENTDFNFILFNNVGQAVAKGNAHGMAQIHVEGIAKGIYFLHITSGMQARVVKVVVE